MDIKLRIWLLVLFAVMTSGDDPKNTTVSSIGGDAIAAGDVTKKAVIKDILALMKSELMTSGQKSVSGKQSENDKYSSYCDSMCTVENREYLRFECEGRTFDPKRCGFYKSAEHLSCYACPKDPQSNNLEDCPSNNDNIQSLPWPCKDHYTEEEHQKMFYNGFKQDGDPVCSKHSTTVTLPDNEIVHYNVRTCSLHVGELGCSETPRDVVDKLKEMFKAAYGPMAKVTHWRTCFCKSSNCNSIKDTQPIAPTKVRAKGEGTRLSGPYYDIWTWTLGFAAILSSYNILLV